MRHFGSEQPVAPAVAGIGLEYGREVLDQFVLVLDTFQPFVETGVVVELLLTGRLQQSLPEFLRRLQMDRNPLSVGTLERVGL